jgi:hypothetical protein
MIPRYPQVGAAKGHRVAQGLPLRNHDVGAVASGSAQQAEADRVDADDRQRPPLMRGLDEPCHVFEMSKKVRLLQDDGGGFVGQRGGERARLHAAVRCGHRDELGCEVGEVGRDDLAVLRVHRAGEHDPALAPGDAQRHQHRLGHGGAAVVEAGVRDVHAGQLGDQRLVFERRLERPLARLGLIGGVGGVILTPRGEVIDHGRNEMVVASCAEETRSDVAPRVPANQAGDVRGQFHFAQRWGDRQRACEPVFRRDHVEELIERVESDRPEHDAHVVGRVRDIGHGSRVLLRTGHQWPSSATFAS